MSFHISPPHSLLSPYTSFLPSYPCFAHHRNFRFRSFARIFFRSAINQGLLVIECPDAVEGYREGDEVEVDGEAGIVRVGGREFRFPPYPPKVKAILEAGGLTAYLRNR